MSDAVESFGQVQKKNNRFLLLIHIIKQYIGKVKFSISTLQVMYAIVRIEEIDKLGSSDVSLLFAGPSLSPDLRTERFLLSSIEV